MLFPVKGNRSLFDCCLHMLLDVVHVQQLLRCIFVHPKSQLSTLAWRGLQEWSMCCCCYMSGDLAFLCNSCTSCVSITIEPHHSLCPTAADTNTWRDSSGFYHRSDLKTFELLVNVNKRWRGEPQLVLTHHDGMLDLQSVESVIC